MIAHERCSPHQLRPPATQATGIRDDANVTTHVLFFSLLVDSWASCFPDCQMSHGDSTWRFTSSMVFSSSVLPLELVWQEWQKKLCSVSKSKWILVTPGIYILFTSVCWWLKLPPLSLHAIHTPNYFLFRILACTVVRLGIEKSPYNLANFFWK